MASKMFSYFGHVLPTVDLVILMTLILYFQIRGTSHLRSGAKKLNIWSNMTITSKNTLQTTFVTCYFAFTKALPQVLCMHNICYIWQVTV